MWVSVRKVFNMHLSCVVLRYFYIILYLYGVIESFIYINIYIYNMHILNVSRVGIMSFSSVFEGLILGNFLGGV